MKETTIESDRYAGNWERIILLEGTCQPTKRKEVVFKPDRNMETTTRGCTKLVSRITISLPRLIRTISPYGPFCRRFFLISTTRKLGMFRLHRLTTTRRPVSLPKERQRR